MIRTVLRDIEPAAAGVFSSHEHLLCDQTMFAMADIRTGMVDDRGIRDADWPHVARDPLVYRENLRLADEEQALRELAKFQAAGGSTIVDLTTKDFGRSPHALAELSRRSGVNIVMGSGAYISSSRSDESLSASVDDLAEEIIRDVRIGHDGVRAGVIGEIGCSAGLPAPERRALHAAAIAQQATGAAIAVHPPVPRAREGMAVIDELDRHGADLTRTALCHSDYHVGNLDYLKSLLDRGVSLMFDRFGNSWEYLSSPGWAEPSDASRVDAIRCLIDDGYLGQLHLGQDVCMRVNITEHGGQGYAHLLTGVASLFQDYGLGADTFRALTEANPQKMFDLAID